MQYVFSPPLQGSTLSMSGTIVRKGDTVELDDKTAARILASNGAGSLIPVAVEPAKPATRKKPAAKAPAPVDPEPEAEGDEGGEPA